MTRRVSGFHRAHGPYHHPAAPLAPYVSVRIGDRDDVPRVDFMIDTGADFTIIAPRDAWALLGESYAAIDFTRLAGDFERSASAQLERA